MIRACIVLVVCVTPALADDSSWKAPLSEKEAIIEARIRRTHNIQGLYPSLVQIPPRGAPGDIYTTNPFADVVHAVCWTSNHLAGLSFKTAVLEKSGAPQAAVAAARARADEVFEAVYRCQRITGRRGLQARGYLLGHGEVYDERAGHSGKLPYWRQGEADGQDYRWVGDPSHHNYSDAVHGLMQYYTLAATGPQKERAREAIDALVSYWVDNDLKIAEFDPSFPAVPILGLTDGKTLNTRVMMAIAGAKFAHVATGKEKFKAVYDRLISQYRVRGLKSFETEKGFDDAEHVLCHLEVLFRVEDDPELRAAFRKVADSIWSHHTRDAQSLFTYIYYGLAPDAPEKEQALREALYSLQTYPSDTTQTPQMNSLFPDRKPPYPTYQAAWDNEYIWKGNLLGADGWLSRLVVDVAVSPEDAQVIYAVGEEGEVYQSRDGAATWENWTPITKEFQPAVKDVDVGSRSRILAAAASDGFYVSTNTGALWRRLPVPSDNGTPVTVAFDPNNPNLLYATTTYGAYRSVDFGEDYLGETWETLTSGLPQRAGQFMVVPGEPGRIYALIDDAIFTRRLDAKAWTRAVNRGIGEYAETYPWMLTDPANPDRVVGGFKSNYSGFGPLSVVQESVDAAQTWTNDFTSILRTIQDKGLLGVMTLGVRAEINRAVMDPADPRVVYAAGIRGVMKSTDGGKTWSAYSNGMRIPRVERVFKPRHTPWVFAATPGGLQVSKDAGVTWEDANLWLQFSYNTRRELGGADFIDAYWRGRYYGFIDEITANAPGDAKPQASIKEQGTIRQ
jgi:hypothetical protein